MARHAAAQSRHALAQAWQCWCLCLAHSSPQVSQMPAHSAQMAFACSLPRAMAAAANWQAAAQSMSSAMHLAIIWTSGSFRQDAAQ